MIPAWFVGRQFSAHVPEGARSGSAGVHRSATQSKQAQALRKWKASDLPTWLDEDFYRQEILPRLSSFTVKKIRLAIDVSHPYATLIKRGDKIPHPKHWLTLGRLILPPVLIQ